MTARALSIQQPWAWAITDLDKRVENRSKPTSFRGEVFIHASAKARPLRYLDCLTDAEMIVASDAHMDDQMPLGAIVGVMQITDCICAASGTAKDSGDRWLEGPWAYVLENVIKLPRPVPCKGALGFWRVPADVEAEVRKQLAEIEEENVGKKKKAETNGTDGTDGGLTTDPPANSPEDLGYSGKRGEKRLDPQQREQLERIARQIATATRDVDEKASARGKASNALKQAQKDLKRLVAEQNAVIAGNWSPGMFDESGDGDEGGDEEE